jgi:predicted dehydrogenase/threonine dehydrogenase-like Zn-dependent dehydrogenase
MRQVARRLRDGRLELVEVPDPAPAAGRVAVRVEASIISSGTERATLEVARSSLLAKARARPEQARAVVQRARREGVRSTLALVRQRLDQLGPLGYSAAGTAVDVGEGVRGIGPGDTVAIGGGGFANHAEVDVVPSLLCARVPDGVESEEAAFATLGAIALNGFRRGDVAVGSTVAVIGLGLIGQLAVRIARAAGCHVLGIDLEPSLCELARKAGAEVATRSEISEESAWVGAADAVLICASSDSADPVNLAASLARDRAAVVVVGDVPMDVPRTPFYEKELDLRLARSYGPGRYDPAYELHGLDYPIGQVRWTQQRNMTAFLELVADGRLRPSELISHRFAFSDAEEAFDVLASERPVAVALAYDQSDRDSAKPDTDASPRPVTASRTARRGGKPRFGIVGAGSFATGTLIPGLVKAGFEPAVIASATGLSARDAGDRFGFDDVAGDIDEIVGRDDIELLVVATRHDSHAELAVKALEGGHFVYVEKPLVLEWDELARVRDAQRASGSPLVIGFNRRFSEAARALRGAGSPRLMHYRVNAGRLPADHWTNDPMRGGGRLRGEGCHFIDFLCDQAGADPVRATASGFRSSGDLPLVATDNFAVQIDFADGSVGTLQYAADAPVGPGKERFEMSAPGLYAVVDDFRHGSIWRDGRRRSLGGRRQDKGFDAQFSWLARIARGEEDMPSADSYLLSTLATLAAARSLQAAAPVPVVAGEAAAAVDATDLSRHEDG